MTQQNLDLAGSFPFDRHPHMRTGQERAVAHLEQAIGTVIHELAVGSGKTALGITFLEAHRKRGARQCFFITPNKAQVGQIKELYPDHVHAVYGRSEYPCLYNPDEKLRADEIPCTMLVECAHRVDQDTGETYAPGAIPCPYLRDKYLARKGDKIVVATDAFYLYVVLFSDAFSPEAVAIDEVHRLAQSIRTVLSTELTDWKIERAMQAIEETSPRQCEKLAAFLLSMKAMVKHYAFGKETLLEESQLQWLYKVLTEIDANRLEADARNAVASGRIDPMEEREVLKQIEDVARSVRRFQRSLRYAMQGATARGYPLNFVIAYGKTEMGERDKVQYRLTIKDYYVVPILEKILPKATYAFSATIADPQLLAFETGVRGEFASIPSSFPIENARIYMPTDTANLSLKKRDRRDKNKMLRLCVRAAKRFADKGQRSLMLVVSNEERKKFLTFAEEERFDAFSYDQGLSPRECAQRFRDGQGQCLVGTVAHFGEGLDLPAQMAPIIFYYRPGYPPPDDPQSIFEARRFGERRVWSLWRWRLMVELLQVRGRNIRSETDLGVTFLISQHFRDFAFKSLPEWLKPAYRGQLTFEECVADAEKLLLPE